MPQFPPTGRSAPLTHTKSRTTLPAPLRVVLDILAFVRAGLIAAAYGGGVSAQPVAPDLVTLSIIETNDLHGRIFPRNGRGDFAVLAGYVNNLRAVRKADGGAVLLIDAGNTFQGTAESNLAEGAVVIDAYNALGYAAAPIGNHEFYFWGVDSVPPDPTGNDDMRAALKAIAARANCRSCQPILTRHMPLCHRS